MKIFLAITLATLLQWIECSLEFENFLNSVFGGYDHIGMCPSNPPPVCQTKLLQFEWNSYCHSKRKEEVDRSRIWYQITNGSHNVRTEYPAPEIPFLNQNMKSVIFHYSTDPDESRYLSLYSTWQKVYVSYENLMNTMFSNVPFRTFAVHERLHNTYNNLVKQLNTPQYFDNPSMHADFTDQINTQSWDTDEAFTQRRLAEQCPFTLRKVTTDDSIGLHKDTLSTLLNSSMLNDDTLIEIDDGEHITAEQAINNGRLFVSYIEDLDEVNALNRNIDNTTERVVRNVTSTIALYILRKDGMLRIVAIQWDSNPNSPVYTPSSDPIEWGIAKAQVELVENLHCQAYHHLGSMHYVYTVFCLAYRRHFSKKHPLYDMFKFHCEGTIPHIATAYPVLTEDETFSGSHITVGGSGMRALAEKAFHDREYGKYDYNALIKERGLDDDRIKYYPFRDDSILLLKEFRKFANEIIKLYYGRRFADYHIKTDSELQSFANEISADGVKPDGGIGKFIGFPSRITSRKQLKQFIVRFLWQNVIHTVVNYALAPNFVPTQPKILFANKNGSPVQRLEEIYAGYGDPKNAIAILSMTGTLSNFRANRLMDYSEKTRDKRYGKIVRRSYYRLHKCVQKELEKRNKKRKERNMLGYQILEPKWIVNSVHI